MTDETVVRRLDFRVIRPDGTVLWQGSFTNQSTPRLPRVTADGWLAPWRSGELISPPFIFQRHDDGTYWETFDPASVPLPPSDYEWMD